MSRVFHLGDILSVTTGRLVSPGGIPAVHEFLDFMTGDRLFTHQLPRACEECAPELLRQHPDLELVVVPEFTSPAHVQTWLADQVERFGEHRTVVPLPPGDHTRIDPIAELRMMRPDMPIIAVELPPDGTP
jgi:hypothetical protein